MTAMQILWWALGLSVLGFLMIWAGAWFEEIILWLGVLVFYIGMLLGPLSRFIAVEEPES